MTKLQLLKQVQSWTKSFLKKRKAELAFDEEKQEIQDIKNRNFLRITNFINSISDLYQILVS